MSQPDASFLASMPSIFINFKLHWWLTSSTNQLTPILTWDDLLDQANNNFPRSVLPAKDFFLEYVQSHPDQNFTLYPGITLSLRAYVDSLVDLGHSIAPYIQTVSPISLAVSESPARIQSVSSLSSSSSFFHILAHYISSQLGLRSPHVPQASFVEHIIFDATKHAALYPNLKIQFMTVFDTALWMLHGCRFILLIALVILRLWALAIILPLGRDIDRAPLQDVLNTGNRIFLGPFYAIQQLLGTTLNIIAGLCLQFLLCGAIFYRTMEAAYFALFVISIQFTAMCLYVETLDSSSRNTDISASLPKSSAHLTQLSISLPMTQLLWIHHIITQQRLLHPTLFALPASTTATTAGATTPSRSPTLQQSDSTSLTTNATDRAAAQSVKPALPPNLSTDFEQDDVDLQETAQFNSLVQAVQLVDMPQLSSADLNLLTKIIPWFPARFPTPTCSICSLTLQDQVTVLPCGHFFHEYCCAHWYSYRAVCGQCNESVFKSISHISTVLQDDTTSPQQPTQLAQTFLDNFKDSVESWEKTAHSLMDSSPPASPPPLESLIQELLQTPSFTQPLPSPSHFPQEDSNQDGDFLAPSSEDDE